MNGLILRKTTMKVCNLIFYSLVGVCIGGMVYYNLTPEKTPHHTSTVSGSSGDLKCTTSCVIKEQ
jgi:hypothetical protein